MIRCLNSLRSCKGGRRNRILILGIVMDCWKEEKCTRLKGSRRRGRWEGRTKIMELRRRSLICHSFKPIRYWVNCSQMIELREKVQIRLILETPGRSTPERRPKFHAKVWLWHLFKVYLVMKALRKLRLELQVRRQVGPNTIHIQAVAQERSSTEGVLWKLWIPWRRKRWLLSMERPTSNHLSLPVNQPPTSSRCRRSIFTASSKKS